MVAFYKHDIPALMDGTEALSDGAYHVIVQLIMLNEGTIVLNERGIASRCNQALKTFKRNLDELLAVGKLLLSDGRLSNARATIELEGIEENRRNAGKGRRKSGKTRRNRPGIPADPEQISTEQTNDVAKLLELQDAGEAPLPNDRSLKEKTLKATPIVPKGTEAEGFAEFSAAYPKRITAFPTTVVRKRWSEARKRGAPTAEIIGGAKAYAAEQARIGNVGTKYVKTADIWLHQGYWKDYATPSPTAGPAPAPVTDDTWRQRAQLWRSRGGYWPWRPSEPPDDPRTLVPQHILTELGIGVPDSRPALKLMGTGCCRALKTQG